MTVTKNPIILQSCNYIYNWFITQIQTNSDNQEYNLLEVAETDKAVMKKIKNEYLNKNKYSDIDKRLSDIKGENVADY